MFMCILNIYWFYAYSDIHITIIFFNRSCNLISTITLMHITLLLKLPAVAHTFAQGDGDCFQGWCDRRELFTDASPWGIIFDLHDSCSLGPNTLRQGLFIYYFFCEFISNILSNVSCSSISSWDISHLSILPTAKVSWLIPWRHTTLCLIGPPS